MEVAKILENKPKGYIYGLMGNINLTTNNNNYSIITDYKFNGTVEEYLNSPKAASSLKMVLLDENVMPKNARDLSIGELKKVSLAKALIDGKDYLVLDYFDKSFNHKEIDYFIRLIKRMTSDYHKTVILFTNDITILWNNIEELLIVDEYFVINTIPKEKYFEFIDKLNEPEIVRFTKLMKELGLYIENYKDTQDLLKAIYRLKEQE
ncbi:MAG TPA: hypothetical protein IAB49_02830 [Candidatus Caccenecus avistercoris]|nr:hypothetical protein [Candidatus Caccenecus avistercoris]